MKIILKEAKIRPLGNTPLMYEIYCSALGLIGRVNITPFHDCQTYKMFKRNN